MNIFVTSTSPERSARALDDRRLIKMAVESGQLLSTALWLRKVPAPYRPTHVHHPAASWTGATRGNFLWVLNHLRALTTEYAWRFGRTHATSRLVPLLQRAAVHVPKGRRQPFVNLSGFPRVAPTTEAYRRGLRRKWQSGPYPPRWTRRSPPRWARDALKPPA